MPGPEPDWDKRERAGGRLCPTGNVAGGPGWPTTDGSNSQARVLQKLCAVETAPFFPQRRLDTWAEPGQLLPQVAPHLHPYPQGHPWCGRLVLTALCFPSSTSVCDSAGPCCLEFTLGRGGGAGTGGKLARRGHPDISRAQTASQASAQRAGAILLGLMGAMSALCCLIRHFKDKVQVKYKAVEETRGKQRSPAPPPSLSKNPLAPWLLFPSKHPHVLC